jgi:hypothetical protein
MRGERRSMTMERGQRARKKKNTKEREETRTSK